MNARLLITFFILVAGSHVSAQLTVTGELRPRAEMRNGYRMLPTDSTQPAFFVSQRTRLGVTFQKSGIKSSMVFQDVRVWGDEVHLADVSSLGLHEAWAEVPFGKKYALKAGRQELVYDDHRLLGNVDWVQAARSHDAALVKYAGKKLTAHFGGAYNQLAQNNFGTVYPLSNYKALAFLYTQFKPKDKLKLSVTAIGDAYQESPAVSHAIWRFTSGAHGEFSPKSWLLKASGFYQTGETPSRKAISAWMAACAADYIHKRGSIGAGVDVFSGTDAAVTDKHRTFNTLYATNHKFYGHMDYFINIPDDTRNGGLMDAFLKGALNIGKSKVGLDAHYFRLMADISDPRDVTFILPRALGTEFDLHFSHKLASEASLQLGYSILLTQDGLIGLQSLTQSNTAHWGWVMLVVKPEGGGKV